MRVGFDAKRLFCNFTGLGNYSRTLVGNLASLYRSDKYILYTERLSHNPEALPFADQPYEVVVPRRKFLWRLWRVSGVVKRQKIDIFHGLSHDLPIGIGRSGARSIVTIHDVCYKTYPAMFPLVERMIYEWKYRHSCRVADCIVAISESTKRDIVCHFGINPQKIEVIYQAINPIFYNPISPETARTTVEKYGVTGDYLLYVGSINSRKNLKGIIEAYAQLDAAHRLPLVVIGGGGGAYLKQCMEAAEAADVARHIIRFDSITSMQALQAFYTAARVMIYPSFYEGFGLPVAEALLSHCPVITSSVSSLPEAGGDGALYVDPSDVGQIAGAIITTLDNEPLARELARKGRDYVVENFDPARLTSQIHDLYEKLMVK